MEHSDLAAVRTVRVADRGFFAPCLIKQVDFDWGLSYLLQQWIPVFP